MKKLAVLVPLTFVAGLAFAQEAKQAEPAKAPAKHAAVKTHDVEAEVVSTDAIGKTITVKVENENKTLPVEGKAIASLKTVKAGEKVKLTCRDNEKGEHQAVEMIKPAKAAEQK
jgi:hypothetical protein